MKLTRKKFAILWTSDAIEYCQGSFNQSSGDDFNLFVYGLNKKNLVGYYNGISLHVVAGLSTRYYFTGYGQDVARTSRLCTLFSTDVVNTPSATTTAEDDDTWKIIVGVTVPIGVIVIAICICICVACDFALHNFHTLASKDDDGHLSISYSFKITTHIPYIGNFSRREILAKMTHGRCVKFSQVPIFAILRTLNEDA